MGTKVTISPITNPENSSFPSELNAAVDTLSDEFDKVVYRDGSFDLTNDLDCGSNRLYNLGAPVDPSDAVRLVDIDNLAGAAGNDGADGADAVNPNYTYSINTGAPGTDATLLATGTYPNVTLTFTIPRGTAGASGALGDGNYTDITVSGTGSVLTVNAAAITLAKMANIATARFIGRTTAGTGVPEAMTGTQATALLDTVGASKGLMSSADKTKLDGIATAATANSSDATLLNRANHTGTQAQSTVTNLVTDLAAKASRFMSVVSLSADTTLTDATHANNLILFTGGTSRIITLNGTPTAGFSAIVSHRGSTNWTLSVASGVYKNGAASTVTSITVAPGAHFTIIHEGSGVWTADGSGLT